MAALRFQIEIVEPRLGMLIARQLDLAKFRVVERTTLAGAPVLAATRPPATDPDTAMRDDLFVMRLRRRADIERFKVGAVVELAEYAD